MAGPLPHDDERERDVARAPRKGLALLKGFPRLGYKPSARPILGPDDVAPLDLLADDVAVLDELLVPQFEELDREALRAQNSFRLAQTLLIAGGMLATILGAIQAAGEDLVWPGLAEAGVLVLLGAVLFVARELRFQQTYIDSRLRAERLCEEYFRFLARVGEYGSSPDGERARVLRRRVHTIRSESRS